MEFYLILSNRLFLGNIKKFFYFSHGNLKYVNLSVLNYTIKKDPITMNYKS